MPTMSGKRARKPVQKLGDFEDSGVIGNDTGSFNSTSAGSNSRASQLQRAGRANKKRDDRSALVEVWMCKNESGNKPATVVKEEYAKQLRIRKDLFWDTMKAYALKSKLACIPDFEQIWHHMKDDKADLLQDLRLQGVDYWWEQETDEMGNIFYKPNTQNLKNFKPASGLLHHFYQVYIHDEGNYDAVRNNPKATGSRFRTDPDELDELVAKLSPFRVLPEPKALLVLPNSMAPLHLTLRGTYALSKKVNNFNVFIRPARQIAKGKGAAFRSVVLNGTTVDVPAGKAENYASVENALALLCKEDKKDEGESEVFHQVPFRMRVPPSSGGGGGGEEAAGGMLEATIEDLGESMFDLTSEVGVMVYPVRGLLPIPEIMRFIDFGAVWHGCFSPFPRTAASFQEFVAHFDLFPEECLNFFFFGGGREGEREGVKMQDVLAEEYIRFMTWFANCDDGLGQGCCNARALYQALEGQPFHLGSQSEELRGRGRVGGYALRLSDTKPQCLTVEVLQQGDGGEEEGVVGNVLCFRVRVTFSYPSGGAAAKKTSAAVTMVDGVVLPQVQFSLEDAEGKTSVTSRNNFVGPILKKIEQQAGLSAGVVLTPLPLEDWLSQGGREERVVGKGTSTGTTSSTSSSGGRRRSMGPPAARGSTAAAAGAAAGPTARGVGGRGKGVAGATTAAAVAATLKRKRAAVEDLCLPPPMSKMGTAGASAFNDQTFDISGAKQLAAARMKRGVSNVLPASGREEAGRGEGGGLDSPSTIPTGNSNGAPLTVWGQHIPMPSVGRDHSLGPPPMLSANSLTGGGVAAGGGGGVSRQDSIGKGDSWGSMLKNIEGLSPPGVAREHSLGLGLSGFSRDMSLGSLGDLPRLSRGTTQEEDGMMIDGAREDGEGKGEHQG